MLLQKWKIAIAFGIESQGGHPHQQVRLQDECLWKGWAYKKGVANTAWKRRFLYLTAVSVMFVSDPHIFAGFLSDAVVTQVFC